MKRHCVKAGAAAGTFLVAVAGVWVLAGSAVVEAQSGSGPPRTLTNSIGMDFVLVPSGSFRMGADPNFEDASREETPRHSVTISRAFYLGKYEVTQEQWVAVMGTNPSRFKGRTNPVEQVSWDDAQAFIRRLNAKEGGSRYRLPTEAEWEYAARAGATGKFCFGDDDDQLGRYAWFEGNSGEKTHPVGQLRPNAWGLYDMHGNVWEWVQDWYDGSYYGRSPSTDPRGPATGTGRVFRGGFWDSVARYCRAAARNNYTYGTPGYRYDSLGFRLARSSP